MKVYTYYMPVPGLWPEDTQLKLIELWKKSWTKQGWEPVVLTEADAQKHPRYAEFKKKFWELPTIYGHDYEGACFLRWVATAAAGGGMLTDYDVINYGMPPTPVDPKRMRILADKPIPLFLGVVHGPSELFEGVCQMFTEWVPGDRDWYPKISKHHCSDLSFMQQLLDSKNRECPEWLHWENGCTLYPKLDGPLVHYGYVMHDDGYWPKCDHIEKLRPI